MVIDVLLRIPRASGSRAGPWECCCEHGCCSDADIPCARRQYDRPWQATAAVPAAAVAGILSAWPRFGWRLDPCGFGPAGWAEALDDGVDFAGADGPYAMGARPAGSAYAAYARGGLHDVGPGQRSWGLPWL